MLKWPVAGTEQRGASRVDIRGDALPSGAGHLRNYWEAMSIKPLHSLRWAAVAASLALAGCAGQLGSKAPAPSPAQVQAQVVRLLPAKVADRQGWARDIQVAFTAQGIEPSKSNLCAVLAVAEQESTYQVDPPVPGLGKIARSEIDRRAAKVHVPSILVSAALQVSSPNGKSYSERLAGARTEKELSTIFDDFIGSVPMGKTLFGGFNPVHTGGPMQVSIDFAEQQARNYPYSVDGSIRREVFSRRGGMYFGIAHLLGYPVNYPQPLYRFADFNAGWYASRNAAFQNALSVASGISLALDGDLIRYDSIMPGSTELAARALGKSLDMRNPTIRNQLEKGNSLEFEDTTLYKRVFALADQAQGKPLPRQILPGIQLKSPKITRKLTTAWFAKRVDERYQRCMAR
ncbi:surface-exposed outer membrane lipoprotein [Pseudomonas chlororaphis]